MKLQNETDLTFGDVFLKQWFSDITSRSEVSLTPLSPLSTTLPIFASNMNSVIWRVMAETIARYGWIALLPQDMSLDEMLEVVKHVHNADIRFDAPLIVKEDDTVSRVWDIIHERSHKSVILVDEQNKALAIVREEDVAWYDQSEKLKNITFKNFVTGGREISNEDAFNLMEEHQIPSLPIVDDENILVWILAKNDALRGEFYTPAVVDGHLDVAVALAVNGWRDWKLDALVKAGVTTFCLDTAHWFVEAMWDSLRDIRKKYPDLTLIAWNVMWWDGAKFLLEAWANGVKIWIGPGGMCTTRMKTWVWRPQFSAVLEAVEVAQKMWWFVIADGWIKHPRDVSLALAAWASHVMLWTNFAWTFESPGVLKEDEQWFYKDSWWMASLKAVHGRNDALNCFKQAKKERFKEWVSGAKIRNIKPLGEYIDDYTTGLASAMTYTWARTLEEFTKKAVIGRQNPTWYIEGTPHGEK